MTKFEELSKWALSNQYKNFTVWIGRNGSAVCNDDADAPCYSISKALAERFIKNKGLREVYADDDGIAYSN